MHEALIGELRTFMIKQCDTETLLDEHQDAGGGKCSRCKTGKYAYAPWPCTIYKVATQARNLVAARRPVMRRAG
jgi:hypothetical protein